MAKTFLLGPQAPRHPPATLPRMRQRSFALLVLLALLAGAAVYAAAVYPSLPDPMAAHFDGSGKADGYQGKRAFFTLYGVMLAVMVGTFVGLAFLIPRMPASLINLPNKDVHLAPERREETLAEISAFLVWMGVATVAFLVWVLHLTFQANLREGEPTLGEGFLVVLIAYMLLVLGWTVRFFLRYR